MAEHQATVRPTEAERIGHRHSHLALARLVANDIQIAIRIGLGEVRVDRQHAVLNSERAEGGLDRASSRDQMSDNALGRTHCETWNKIPEYRVHRGGLATVVHRCGRPVRVEVVDLIQRRASIVERLPHRLNRPIARGMRIGDAVAAQRITLAGQFGVDVSTAPPGRLPLFEHEESGTLAQNEAIATGVEGSAGALRRIVVRRDGIEQAKTGQADR